MLVLLPNNDFPLPISVDAFEEVEPVRPLLSRVKTPFKQGADISTCALVLLLKLERNGRFLRLCFGETRFVVVDIGDELNMPTFFDMSFEAGATEIIGLCGGIVDVPKFDAADEAGDDEEPVPIPAVLLCVTTAPV